MTIGELEAFHAQLNEKLNRCIGQIVVPRMKYRDSDIIEVHDNLLALAAWIDETFESDAVREELP